MTIYFSSAIQMQIHISLSIVVPPFLHLGYKHNSTTSSATFKFSKYTKLYISFYCKGFSYNSAFPRRCSILQIKVWTLLFRAYHEEHRHVPLLRWLSTARAPNVHITLFSIALLQISVHQLPWISRRSFRANLASLPFQLPWITRSSFRADLASLRPPCKSRCANFSALFYDTSALIC